MKTKMKKIFFALLTVLLTSVLLSGCQSEQKDYENRLEEVLGRGELIVATSPDFVPLEFLDANGNPAGSDISLAQYIAEQLNVDLKIETMDFSTTLTAVDTGKADMAISGFGWTTERAENYELSIGFNKGEESCHGLLIREEDYDKFQTFEDFDGTTIGAQANSLQEMYATDQILGATIEPYTTIDIGVLSLASYKLDAIAVTCEIAEGNASSTEGLIKAYPEFYLDETNSQEGNVIAIKKGESELLAAVNEILIDVNENGYYDEWHIEAEALAATLTNIDENAEVKTPGVFEVFIENWPLFLNGLLMTLWFSFIAVFFGSILGGFIAMLQFMNNKVLNIVLKVYVTVLRGTPLLVQLYIAYIFIPMAIPSLNVIPKEMFILFALVVNSSAYVAEIIRGGINAVDKGQTEAARSLGMSSSNCMKKIILPQAIKNILPALGNEYITMIKETSIAATLSVGELMYVRTILANQFLMWQPLFVIAIIYLLVTLVLTYFVNLLEKRLSVSD